MKYLTIAVVTILLFSVGVTFAAKQNTVVVFPFKADGVSQKTSEIVTEKIRALLNMSGRVVVLERNQMDRILETHGLNYDEMTAESEIEMGNALDANKILTGTIRKSGSDFIVSASYLDVETTIREITASRTFEGISETNLHYKINELVALILDRIPAEGQILDITNAGITVDIGSNQDAKPGDRLAVNMIRKISDPQTGKLIHVPYEIGELEIVKLTRLEHSICKVVSGSGFEVGNSVILKRVVSEDIFKERRKKAILYSSLVPGMGQITFKQNRGWLYTLGSYGMLAMGLISLGDYSTASDDYDIALENYEATYGQAEWELLQGVKEDRDNYQTQMFLYTGVGVGIWVWSVVDAIYWGGGEEIKLTQNNPEKVQFALIPCPNRVTLRISF